VQEGRFPVSPLRSHICTAATSALVGVQPVGKRWRGGRPPSRGHWFLAAHVRHTLEHGNAIAVRRRRCRANSTVDLVRNGVDVSARVRRATRNLCPTRHAAAECASHGRRVAASSSQLPPPSRSQRSAVGENQTLDGYKIFSWPSPALPLDLFRDDGAALGCRLGRASGFGRSDELQLVRVRLA
jgi:hypothetical protein